MERLPPKPPAPGSQRSGPSSKQWINPDPKHRVPESPKLGSSSSFVQPYYTATSMVWSDGNLPDTRFHDDKLEQSEQKDTIDHNPHERIREEHHNDLVEKSAVALSTDAQIGNPTTPPILEDARGYIDRVKAVFAQSPKVYNKFLNLLKDHGSQRIDTPGVINRIRELFHEHAGLKKGFGAFFPPEWADYVITGNIEDIPPMTTAPEASSSDQQKQASPSPKSQRGGSDVFRARDG
ncbi:paired amphipathic helix [Xylaria curta]|nr:paired amphipathic helix [Xylaria curta]